MKSHCLNQPSTCSAPGCYFSVMSLQWCAQPARLPCLGQVQRRRTAVGIRQPMVLSAHPRATQPPSTSSVTLQTDWRLTWSQSRWRSFCFTNGTPSPEPSSSSGDSDSQGTQSPARRPNTLPLNRASYPRLSAHPPYNLSAFSKSPSPLHNPALHSTPSSSKPSIPTKEQLKRLNSKSSKGTAARAQAKIQIATATAPAEHKWLIVLKAFLGQVASMLRAVAITFCLIVLMLMRPRVAGADSARADTSTTSTSTISSKSSHKPGHITSASHMLLTTSADSQASSPHAVSTQLEQQPTFSAPAQLAGAANLKQPTTSIHHTDSTSTSTPATASTSNAVSNRHNQPTNTVNQPTTSNQHTSTAARSSWGRAPFASISMHAAGPSRSRTPASQAAATSQPAAPLSSSTGSSAAAPNPVFGSLAEQQDGPSQHGPAGQSGPEEGAAEAAGGTATPPPAAPLTGQALLATQEAAVMNLFRSAQASVVNISGARAAGTFSSLDISRFTPGQGSGFVWDERGHVVTSYSCVRGAAEVKVTLSDASSFTAKLVGYDAGKDVAVLRLSMPKARLKELVPINRAHTTSIGPGPAGVGMGPGGACMLCVGSSVWAVGNASGLDHTLTQGVVSGLGRELPGGGPFPLKGLIQTDAACGHQAGGVLLNTQGRMVGMVVAPSQAGGRAAGYALGYALPLDALRGLVTQILATGRPSRPTLGVTLAPPQVLASQGSEGVLVLEVPPGSPAAAAGIRHTHRDIFGDVILGDVIVGIEGGVVRHAGDLYAALDARKAGDRVRLDILRDGKATSLTLVLGERGAAGALEE